jgi:glucose/arabinose dehydrogenase
LPDNTFYNNDPNANRSKVDQLGLHNPFRIVVDSVTGQLYIGDVGSGTREEVNAAGSGAKFGWPFYERGTSRVSEIPTRYASKPEGIAFFATSHTLCKHHC